MEEKFMAWMPITKSPDGSFIGILSDDSLDRDEEFMTKELLDTWAADSNTLPMLANHENKIEKLVGGWTDKQVITKGENSALVAKPFFLKSNPLGRQTEEMVNEALDKGLKVGISIGAIPHETIDKEIDGKKHKGYKTAEIVEATIVPIQSNRNATFMNLAKSFDLELTKPKKVEDCVKALMSDPDFKPQGGRTKEESAWAVCQAKKEIMEVKKMTEEEPKAPEEPKDVPEEPKDEPKDEEPKDEPKEPEGKEPVDGQEVVDESTGLKSEVTELKKELEEIKKKAVLKATVERPEITETEEKITVEKMLELGAGGK